MPRAKIESKRQLQTSCLVDVEVESAPNVTEPFTLLSPACLKELYNIGDYTVDPSAGSTIAFGSFLNQSSSYSDLALFEQRFGIPPQNTVSNLLSS